MNRRKRMRDHRYSTRADLEGTYRSRSVRAKAQSRTEGRDRASLDGLKHVDDAEVLDSRLHAVRGDVDNQPDEITQRLVQDGNEGRRELTIRPQRLPHEPIKIRIGGQSRSAPRPVRRDVPGAGQQRSVHEPQIVIDRTGDVGVKNEHITRARVMPITLDRRARKLRLHGLLEEAPALRKLVALDQQKETQLAQRRVSDRSFRNPGDRSEAP